MMIMSWLTSRYHASLLDHHFLRKTMFTFKLVKIASGSNSASKLSELLNEKNTDCIWTKFWEKLHV